MAEGRPVIAPFIFVERRIEGTQPPCRLGDLRNKDDQIDVVTAITSQQSASRYRGQSLGHGLSDPADMVSDYGVQLTA
jgi:hypothetical protein